MSQSTRPRGRKIVLAASNSESSEHQHSTWRQMLLATLPARYTKFPFYMLDVDHRNELRPDGQAAYVPHGLRIVEARLLEKWSPDDIAVCYPEQMSLFVGDDTRVVGIHAHNPLGVSFATAVYSHFYGRDVEPLNAAEFRKVILHPALRGHKPHLKIIVGGPGSWQITKMKLQDDWLVDCVVDGEAEDLILPLFEAAVRGEALPRTAKGRSPAMTQIPRISHRSTFGVVEITRGCGRGCQFCSIALRQGKSFPLDHILANVRLQAAEGADTILLTTEDLFLYEQGTRFQTNTAALKRLLESVRAVPGVRHIALSHGTMSPVVHTPEVIEELSPIAVDMSLGRHEASTHPDNRYAQFFIGLETGSPRLFEQFMKGKAYPYRSHQWPDVVLRGMDILNRHNWFPLCTWIVGLPGETEQDSKQSLDLLHALKDAKWCVIPTLFVPLDDTRMRHTDSAKLADLTELQWEFFFTCWRYNLDFFRKSPAMQWKFNAGIPLYYYLLGQRLFGHAMKYPLLRLAHFPERFLQRRLYLNLDRSAERGRETPDHLEAQDHVVGLIPEDSELVD